MTEFSLNNQTYKVPDSKVPGQSSIYRCGREPVIKKSISPKIKTVIDLFNQGLELSLDRPCFGTRTIKNTATGELGHYVWQTYRQIHHRILNFGSGLLNHSSSTKGIGIWATNRPEWTITDLACASYSLYTVALYDTLGPDSVEFVIQHAELETVVCSGNHITDLLKLKHKLPNLKTIISMDSVDDVALAWAADRGVHLVSFKYIEELGEKNRRSQIMPKSTDLYCLMYTSGTTGMPKGVMLTHGNLVSAVCGIYGRIHGDVNDVLISYLPLAHILGRISDNYCLLIGGRLGYFSGDVNLFMDDLQALKPTLLTTVPRLLNRVYAGILNATVRASGVTGALFRHAAAVKLANLEAGKGVTHAFWDRLLFNKVRQVLGGNVRAIACGSAPLGNDVMQFLRIALCCPISEAYGATETCAACCMQYQADFKAGRIGAPVTSNEIKLIDVPDMEYLSTDPLPRGEICVRGANVFKGYYKDEEKTREALDEDGWFHTGDIGMIDERGCVAIIDRKKNIFKLAQGEYIAPEKIENVYAKDPIVEQIFLYGDSLQSTLVAIVVPDRDTLNSVVASKLPKVHAKKLDYAELCKMPEVVQAVYEIMTKVGKKAGLRGFEQVRAIYLESNPFTVENDILTPTQKVKRPQAKKVYEDIIASLYEQINSQVDPTKSKL